MKLENMTAFARLNTEKYRLEKSIELLKNNTDGSADHATQLINEVAELATVNQKIKDLK